MFLCAYFPHPKATPSLFVSPPLLLSLKERIYYPPSTLQVGKPAPTFSNVPAVIDGEISELSLSDYRGQWVVLFFYPKVRLQQHPIN